MSDMPPAELAQSALPPIRTDLEAAKADLDRYGLTRISGAAPMADFAAALERLADQAAGEVEAGIAHRDSGYTASAKSETGNQRVWNLLNKGDIFARLVVNETACALARHMLGQNITLFSATANIARRGGVAQRLHGDQVFAPSNTPYPLIANTMWMLDEFTAENGATRVVPGTHTAGRWPGDDEQDDALMATGPAGTLMVWDGRLWHGAGANVTDTPRHGLIIAYGAAFLRSQENHTVSVRADVIDRGSPELRELIGFRPFMGLGMIDGKFADTLPGRPTEFSAELTSSAR